MISDHNLQKIQLDINFTTHLFNKSTNGSKTEKALLPSDDRTYGIERISESEDRVETECDGNERLL